MYQILKGIEYSHNSQIIHRDLKPGNILYVEKENQLNLKLTDFGLARGFGVPTNSFSNEVVTLHYRPPDVLLGNTNYFKTVDIWSIGCIFAEMISGNVLFKGINEMDQIRKIFRILGKPNETTYPKINELPLWKDNTFENLEFIGKDNFQKTLVPKISNDGLDLLLKMLEIDPSKRINVSDCINHSFFEDIKKIS